LANATLFLFIFWFNTVHWCRYEYIGHTLILLGGLHFIYLLANATLFLFIFWFNTVHWCRYEYIGHTLILLGVLHCGCTLKMTGSLLLEDLSCCDCLGG
jgi:hypothetical protein